MDALVLVREFCRAIERAARRVRRAFSDAQHRDDPESAAVSSLSTRTSSGSSTSAEISSPLPTDIEAQSIHTHAATTFEAVDDKSATVRNEPRRPKPRPGNRLMALPPELQLMIIRHLEFGELENLRRTCRFYRTFINRRTVKELFSPNFKHTLLAHCYLCLKHDPTRASLLWADWNDPRYPLASKCVECAFEKGDLTVGRKVALGNYASVWICRMCGYPIAQEAAANQPEFHKTCYARYNNILLVFFVLGWLQWGIGVVAGALCWAYFKGERRVLIPSVINFILLWVSLALLILRGEHLRTYHLAGVLELIILGLWVLPFHTIVLRTQNMDSVGKNIYATLAFIALIMLFRFLNLIGNVILTCEYHHWRRNRPHAPPARRLINWVVSSLVYWTYPQSIEQEYPPLYYQVRFWQ